MVKVNQFSKNQRSSPQRWAKRSAGFENRCEALAKRQLRGWRTWQDSNPQPLDPKSSALSIELQVQMKDGARHREHRRNYITCVNPALG